MNSRLQWSQTPRLTALAVKLIIHCCIESRGEPCVELEELDGHIGYDVAVSNWAVNLKLQIDHYVDLSWLPLFIMSNEPDDDIRSYRGMTFDMRPVISLRLCQIHQV